MRSDTYCSHTMEVNGPDPPSTPSSSPGGEPDIPPLPLKWPLRPGALLTGPGSAESRSVCLWRTAPGPGGVNRRAPVHCRLCERERKLSDSKPKHRALCPRGCSCNLDRPDSEVKSAGRGHAALKSPGSSQDLES